MNKNRREFLKSSCCAMTSAMMLSLLSNKSAYAGSDLPKYCSLQGGISANGIILLDSSGNKKIDNNINFEANHLRESLKVYPSLFFFDDREDPNAHATQERRHVDSDGTVILGIRLLSESFSSHPMGAVAVAGFMAHEFAHIYQYKANLVAQLVTWQSSHKSLELHADYLAGYCMGLKRIQTGEMDIKPFVDALYLVGDSNFTSLEHHGTPLEREKIMLEGYKIGLTNNTDIHQVAQMGIELVRNS